MSESKLILRQYNMAKSNLIFRQLMDLETSTYTYILGCSKTRKAVIIDPVDTMAKRDFKLLKELGLNLVYAINTHVHADHITGSGVLRALIPSCNSAIATAGGGQADVYLEDGQVLEFGEQALECRSTPGHTDGCMTFVSFANEMAFTGDALLIRKCGRTDFQQGSSSKLYDSVQSKIFSLPSHFLLYPGHDYNGMFCTSVGEEKLYNVRLTKSKVEFANIMDNLYLKPPGKLDVSVPANLTDGRGQVTDALISEILNAT